MQEPPSPSPREAGTPDAPDGVGSDVEVRFRVTQQAISEFEEALASLDANEERSDKWRALMRDAVNSQLEDLRGELAELASRRRRRD